MKTLGVIDQPLRMIYTEGAVIVAMIHVMLPYMILPIYSALRSIPPEFARVACNLGAGSWMAFRSVTLPLSLPAHGRRHDPGRHGDRNARRHGAGARPPSGRPRSRP